MSNRADGPRAAVVAEAESWIGTPYHHAARVKGAGCDCLTLLAEVFERAGVIAPIEVPFYPPDWHLHRSAELYMNGVVAHAREIEHSPRTGDIALFRFGRCFAHGAIVTQWPRLIHAWHSVGVVADAADQPRLANRKVRFFSPFPTPDP
jgi:NlpC/P60 family putative phage cell wall peptidase